MALKLYMDHHVPRAITEGLRSRGVDVITSFEDSTNEWGDSELLDRASQLGCVLFTQDFNLLQEATNRQRSGKAFLGVIYAHQLHISVGGCIRDLEIIAKAGETADLLNQVQYLPL